MPKLHEISLNMMKINEKVTLAHIARVLSPKHYLPDKEPKIRLNVGYNLGAEKEKHAILQYLEPDKIYAQI